ncbi:DUF4817 domain-containing protein [Trichonephila clavipes]|uniref:DUF4817 domain-containing protein n=1 Tax=Trichonephila clavipes TaxID=2585209 RepID=A0A8X6S5C0_TRICX|nr:DUF4817 domain-containing protein [Trichonephila clavipes]
MPLNFPGEHHPSYYTIASVVQCLYKTGVVIDVFLISCHTFSGYTEDVLGYALAHPESSVRDISNACSYLKSTVWNILRTCGAYPYRPFLAHD